MKCFLNILTTCFIVLLITGSAFSADNITSSSANNTLSETRKIIAVADTISFTSGCGNLGFGGNVLENDIIPEGMTAKLQYVICSEDQLISFGKDGNFAFLTKIGFNGQITFRYHVCDEANVLNYTEATVYINVKSDFDCDGIIDLQDIDDDNDGILDSVEGSNDTDNDGIPDQFDIDDDNDGIPDIREWQAEEDYKLPSGIDLNKNGLDDVFEEKSGNGEFTAIDTDNDNIPDFLDDDSDNDEINDFIEATDLDFDGLADFSLINSDFDFDGLDDAFDIVKHWLRDFNSPGSNVPLPDHNNNGISDFREKKAIIEGKKDEGKTLTYDSSLITFPNPTSGLFSFQIQNFSTEQESYIRVFDLNGDLKLNIRITQSIVNADLTHLESGIYVVKMVTPDLICSKKLILQNH